MCDVIETGTRTLWYDCNNVKDIHHTNWLLIRLRIWGFAWGLPATIEQDVIHGNRMRPCIKVMVTWSLSSNAAVMYVYRPPNGHTPLANNPEIN